MSDPASHSARAVAALTDVALEGLPVTDVEAVETAIAADLAGGADEAERWSTWFTRGEVPA